MIPQRITAGFDRLFHRYTPDPFIFAILLTAVVALMALGTTDASAPKIVESWGNGFWNLITFTLQMAMILIGGYVVASAPPVQAALDRIIRPIRTPSQAIVATTVIALAASLLNWGLGLVVGAIVAVKVGRRVPEVNFRLLVASAYSGFMVWHGGFSGSIPLLLNTPGNFSEKWIGGTVPLSETLFSNFNLMLVVCMSAATVLTNFILSRTSKPDYVVLAPEAKTAVVAAVADTPAAKLETSRLIMWATGGLGLLWIAQQVFNGKFSLDLNRMNFILIFVGIILHGTARSFLAAVDDAAGKAGPILIQYPFYGGIMSIMTETGLATDLSNLLISFATADNFPLITLYSAGIVNMFVPSGGGQWAVQGPIVIPAAQALGADLHKTILAVAWGDAWTNMVQPFWTLPVLAIAGLQVRDIMGYCVTIMVATGAVITAIFGFSWAFA